MDTLIIHFQEAGFTIFFIVAFGLAAVGAALRFAWRGEHQLLGFIRWSGISVVISGWFGFFIGMLNVLAYVVHQAPPGEQRWLVALDGLREALNNPTAALLLAGVTAVLTAVGHRRFPLPNPSAVAR